MTSISRRRLAEDLKEKAARDYYVESFVGERLALQIRAARKMPDREWSQTKLGELIGTKQSAISRMEDADYGKMGLPTLYALAHAFDLALFVEFMPFDRFCEFTEHPSPRRVELPPFAKVEARLDAWASLQAVPISKLDMTEDGPRHESAGEPASESGLNAATLPESEVASDVDLLREPPNPTVGAAFSTEHADAPALGGLK